MTMANHTTTAAPGTPEPPWQSLHIFNLYRFITVSIITTTFFLTDLRETTFGIYLPGVFTYSILAWLIIALVNGFLSHQRWPRFYWQTTITILLDIGFITLLTYSSGGLGSGLSSLMLVTIAASSILFNGKESFTFAAIATLSLLAMHSHQILVEPYHTDYGFTYVGLLGIGLFAIALLIYSLAKTIRKSEMLAVQHSLRLNELSTINKLIIQQMSTGILVIDHNNKILLQNDVALHLLAHDADITGCFLSDISIYLHTQIQSWRQNPLIDSPPFKIKQKTSKILPRFIHISKAPTAIIAIFLEDMAQLAHQTQQIKLASLGQLTANIAHEIRNPLNAIQHAGQLLGESQNLDPQNQRLTDIIQNQVQRLNTIVENVLSLSRKQDITLEHLDISRWLVNFVNTITDEYHLEPDDIRLHLNDDHLHAQLDHSHLEQILTNLCNNSVRHTENATDKDYRLEISCCHNKATHRIELNVIDTGPGINKNNQEKLFEPFFTTESTGTGLGLYIAHELCELNHGHLSYIDTAGKGAHFRLEFPACPDVN